MHPMQGIPAGKSISYVFIKAMTAAIVRKTPPKRAPFRAKSGATPVDAHVGAQLRKRREDIGMTQQALAQATDLTFQQIQKYENGKNRVSASRLHQFSEILNVPVSYFFDLLGEAAASAYGLAEEQAAFSGPDDDSKGSEAARNTRETAELIRVYYSIPDPKLRKNLLKLIKQMASNMTEGV